MYPTHTNGEPDPNFAAPKQAKPAEEDPKPEPEEAADESSDEVDVSEYHVGGGMYELPNGERVRGKDAAREALDD